MSDVYYAVGVIFPNHRHYEKMDSFFTNVLEDGGKVIYYDVSKHNEPGWPKRMDVVYCVSVPSARLTAAVFAGLDHSQILSNLANAIVDYENSEFGGMQSLRRKLYFVDRFADSRHVADHSTHRCISTGRLAFNLDIQEHSLEDAKRMTRTSASIVSGPFGLISKKVDRYGGYSNNILFYAEIKL